VPGIFNRGPLMRPEMPPQAGPTTLPATIPGRPANPGIIGSANPTAAMRPIISNPIGTMQDNFPGPMSGAGNLGNPGIR
jgi:hypothetical protein